MAKTMTVSSICDWTPLAQNVVAIAGYLDVHLNYSTLIHIQAFLDTDATAHTGTEFVVQGRSSTTDTLEDWYDIVRFVDLVSTAPQLIQASEAISVDETAVTVDENPTTLITIGTTDSTLPWVGVKDADALADSEIITVHDTDADELFVLLGNVAGTEYFENAHADTAAFGNIAMSRSFVVGLEHYYIRVIVNNSYDVNGNTLNFRVRAINVTGI